MTAQEILEQSIGKLIIQNCGLQAKMAELEAKLEAQSKEKRQSYNE